jgi:hypothetical protein
MTAASTESPSNWQPYSLDRYAQTLVLAQRDKKDVLNESHKMRMSVGYGLERFWGEHLRLERENRQKAAYWKAVWDRLWDTLAETSLTIAPTTLQTLKCRIDPNANNASQQIEEVAQVIWNLPIAQQRIALMVLTQLCDALVWWTQRYKKPGSRQENPNGN